MLPVILNSFNCFLLENIDLSPLSNVQSIGDGFMEHCSGLTSIYLSGLLNVQSIGNYFMYDLLK